jgi:hypothetical protein
MRTIEADTTASWDDLTDAERAVLRWLCDAAVADIDIPSDDFHDALYALRAKGLYGWREDGRDGFAATSAGLKLARENTAVSAQDAILGPEERTDAREPVGTAKSPVAHGEA